MSENEHILGGLLRKRAEIAGKIDHLQTELRQLVIHLDHLDSTIHLFAPDLDLGAVKPKPFPPRWSAYQGEIGRVVLDTLRSTKEPMSTEKLALLVMADRHLNKDDKKLVQLMRKRVGSCLRHNRRREVVRSLVGPKRQTLWEIAG